MVSSYLKIVGIKSLGRKKIFCVFSDTLMPDTFFRCVYISKEKSWTIKLNRNEKTGRFHKILAPNLYVRVFPNGDVLYRYLFRFSNF